MKPTHTPALNRGVAAPITGTRRRRTLRTRVIHGVTSALRPANVSTRFDALIKRHAAIRKRHVDGWGVERTARQHRVPVEAVTIALAMPLPPIRFHDLRHGAATMLLASGAPMKLVSEVLGHASSSFTADVYAVVAEELAEQAAAAIAAFVPRRNRAGADRAINVPSEARNDL